MHVQQTVAAQPSAVKLDRVDVAPHVEKLATAQTPLTLSPVGVRGAATLVANWWECMGREGRSRVALKALVRVMNLVGSKARDLRSKRLNLPRIYKVLLGALEEVGHVVLRQITGVHAHVTINYKLG